MFYVLLGTKGQFIKMAPIMKEMDNRGLEYIVIHTGQHTKITEEISKVFGLKKPDVYLNKRENDIVSISDVFRWYLTGIPKNLIKRNEIFRDKSGICLLHGDTPSTLYGLILAKLAGVRVAHIEAGLRSYDLFNPFPEEMIRIITSRFSDYLFAPSEWAYNNLVNERVKGHIFDSKLNTVFDAINYALDSESNVDIPSEGYVIVAVHRNETLYVKERLKIVIETIEDIAKGEKVIFLLHKPTRNRLIKYNFFRRIEANEDITISSYKDYFSFIKLVKNSSYVVTDGGGLQEETTYLNVPCLLLRKKTERIEGLDSNVCLSEFREKRISNFIENYTEFGNKKLNVVNYRPSRYIVDVLEDI